jgi:phosphate:Na+ symporter
MFTRFLHLLKQPANDVTLEVEKLEKMEQYTDQMQEQITQFLIECSRDELNEASATNANLMIRIANEMESVGDSCFTLGLLCQRRSNKKITLPQKALEDLAPYTDLVQKFMAFTRSHLNQSISETQVSEAYHLEEEIDAFRKKLKKSAQIRLQQGAEVKGELLFIDMLQHIEHIGDYCLNISEALRQYK